MLKGDQYIKKIDISGNKVTEQGFKILIKMGLIENQTLICLDGRINTGFSENIQH